VQPKENEMTHNEDYVQQKLEIGVSFLNGGRDSLGKRVRRAWEEISVLDAKDFKNADIRSDYEYLQSRRELYVIEGQTPKLSDAEMDDVRQRIQRIHDAVVR
jgi:hypothetical protein